jgi:hypothetical protein
MSSQLVEAAFETSAPTTNGFTLLAKIKPGQADALREAVQANAKNLGDPEGSIAQIGIVHFVRVCILPGDYFLFTSHFDGEAQAYLDDFFAFTKGAQGFDAVLRYCEDWPGPNDHEGFVEFWMSHQIPEILLGSAYPGATVKEIKKALRVRHNLEAVLEDFQ